MNDDDATGGGVSAAVLRLWRRVTDVAGRIGARELAALILLALASGAIWGFVAIAEEVIEGDTHAFDEAVLLAMRDPADHSDPLGPGWVEELGRDFTALGGVGVLTMLTLASAGFLALQGKGRAALFVLLAIGGGITVSLLLKTGFDRPRPDLVPHGSITYTASFPSGHSMMSAIVYLTLGALLARLQPRLRLKAYLLTLAVLLTVMIGVSRVYLGVHWPTDVLAGWSGGAAWALASWLVALWLQRRGRVESDADDGRAGEPRALSAAP